MSFVALTLISSILCGFICYFIARQRRANYVFWSVMGIALGPLAIPFSLFARPVVSRYLKV